MFYPVRNSSSGKRFQDVETIKKTANAELNAIPLVAFDYSPKQLQKDKKGRSNTGRLF
jgi:hypothetical protein